MKKILIAMDYNPTALKIAEAGCSFAKKMNTEIILLNVISDNSDYSILEYAAIRGFMGFDETESKHLFDEGLRTAMELFLSKLKQIQNDDSIQTMVKVGDTASTILKVSKELHADLIVMGSHSRKWLENILMGSTIKDVLQQTTIPLLLIPTKHPK